MLIIPVFKISADSTIISINPTDSYVTVGKTLSVNVNVTDVAYLTAWQFTVNFDPTILSCTGVVVGPFLETGGSTYYGKTIDNSAGTVLAYDTLLGSSYVSGSGVLATITFTGLAVGDSSLHLSGTKLGDQNIPPQPIAHTTADGTAHVQAFTLTVTVAPSGSGSVTLDDTGPYYHNGEVVTLTAAPTIGWSFSSWSGDLTGSTNQGTLTITSNMAVTATFTQNTYTVSVTVLPSPAAGTVTPNPAGPYHYGDTVVLTEAPNPGYTFSGWSGDGSGTGSTRSVTVTGNMAVTTTFTQNVYTLTINIYGGGTVSPSSQPPYHYGDVVTLTPTANPGWTFSGWTGDGVNGAGNTRVVTITDNMAVTATFTQNTYTLTISYAGDGSGSVSTNQSAPYHYGDVVKLTATPATGSSFSSWSGDLGGSTNPTTITIDGNKAVTATFTLNVYTLTVNVVGTGCSVSRDNNGPYHYNDVVHLTANAALGWTFSQWSGALAGNANPVALTITGNLIVTATFTQDQYTLTVTTTGTGSVGITPSQATYTYGTIVTLTANPAAGWSFDHWSNDLSGTTNPTTITMTGNKAVTATFIQNTYTITQSLDGSGSINVNNSGPYHYGDIVQLTAVPAVGWIFRYWSGDLTGSTSPATLTMANNYTVTAHFTEQPLIQMNPTSRTCRMYNEIFNVQITISNALNVDDFAFEIHYDTTLLTYVSTTWNAWGTGTITTAAGGVIIGSTSGSQISGTQTLITIQFKATFFHVWKSGAINDVSDTIFLQGATVSYPTGPDLRYLRGSINQVNIGPDFVYTFSPIMGDVDNNGQVNVLDLGPLAFYFGTKNGDANWSLASVYDVANSQIIDVFDMRTVASQIPYTYVPPPP